MPSDRHQIVDHGRGIHLADLLLAVQIGRRVIRCAIDPDQHLAFVPVVATGELQMGREIAEVPWKRVALLIRRSLLALPVEPADQNVFQFDKFIDGIFAALAPNAGFLHAAKRRGFVARTADIDPDDAGLHGL